MQAVRLRFAEKLAYVIELLCGSLAFWPRYSLWVKKLRFTTPVKRACILLPIIVIRNSLPFNSKP